MGPSDRLRSAWRSRRRLVALGVALPVVLLTPPCFALVTVLRRDQAPWALVAVLAWLALQLLLVALGVVLGVRWAGRDRSVSGLLDELAVRAAQAEGELRSAEATLSVLRSSVTGIGRTTRMLTAGRLELSPRDRTRLQRLCDAELGRLERQLSGRPGSRQH